MIGHLQIQIAVALLDYQYLCMWCVRILSFYQAKKIGRIEGKESNIFPLTPSRVHSLIYSLAHPPTHSLTGSFIQSLVHSLTFSFPSLTSSFIDSLTCLPSHSLTYSIIHSFMKNTYCLFQVKFITEYTNVQHIIITQI